MVTGVSGPTANIIEPTSTVPMHPAKETSTKSDRRSNKPIMEKRRRARINNCLNELKTLILDATKKDPARHSKLEKADILEKTVKHLQDLQRQQCTMQQATDPKIINKFKAGFSDCINEVSRFPNLDPTVKRRLLQHLHNCINGVRHELNNSQRHVAAAPLSAAATTAAAATATKLNSQRLLQMSFQSLPSPPSSPEQDQPHMQLPQQQQQYLMNTQIQHTPHGFFLSNGLQVIPTKLPNGNIALVLPGNVPASQQQRQPIALSKSILQPANYLNIPSRTSSAGSASSYSFTNMEQTYSNPFMSMQHTSCTPPSPANSHETQSPIHNVQQPLALVTRKLQPQQPQQLKQYIKEEDQPWRPW